MAPLLFQTHTAAQTFPPSPRGTRRLAPAAPHAVGFLRALFPARPPPAKAELLRLIADQGRGLETQSDPSRLADIVSCIDALAASAPNADTVSDATKLSGTWRLLWTTEQEQLFIVRNAPTFRTAAGDVLQVIDVPGGSLNNVITFPPSGAFVVNGSIEIQPPQRVNFRFTRAMLKGGNWEVPFPPFGKGWFDTVYLDDEIRVAKDIRGDYLVVERAPYSWNR
ncbi:probable plastid-lipid-associated protein 11, chloroplastic [Triticum dicoccoides]|uniref:probable plastid-lipid-associated protein 11, chloroplastic n=1 Tax=Triticum dicoccoides TaxID=85692 RepID=UPI00162E7582|nr:probable plastid-lipid-associated protein 11, chloroplastic [Triticum dicoccoides]